MLNQVVHIALDYKPKVIEELYRFDTVLKMLITKNKYFRFIQYEKNIILLDSVRKSPDSSGMIKIGSEMNSSIGVREIV